jgi:hypothetical protein
MFNINHSLPRESGDVSCVCFLYTSVSVFPFTLLKRSLYKFIVNGNHALVGKTIFEFNH